MKWINTKDEFPKEGIYVLARHNMGTWHDSSDQDNVNCVVVKLVKGLSKKDRQLMKAGKIPLETEVLCHFGRTNKYSVYCNEDEDGNNLVPYCWEMFGNDSFFGQDITYWTPIEPLKIK